jgi:hypothetical protein
MASPPRADRQTTIRLPSATYDRLAHAAGLSGSSVGEEIRRRLVASFGPVRSPRPDEKTRELLDVIEGMAAEVEDSFPPWHEDAGSYRAFVTALVRWLQRYEPKGDTALKPKPGTELLFRRRSPTVQSVATLLIGLAKSIVAGLAEAEELAEAQTEER